MAYVDAEDAGAGGLPASTLPHKRAAPPSERTCADPP